jgi:hypothetical protein
VSCTDRSASAPVHVHLADRLEVKDDRVGPRVSRVNSRQHVILKEIRVGEDQFRLEALDQHAGNRRGAGVVLEVGKARAVAAAPQCGDVGMVDRVDQ